MIRIGWRTSSATSKACARLECPNNDRAPPLSAGLLPIKSVIKNKEESKRGPRLGGKSALPRRSFVTFARASRSLRILSQRRERSDNAAANLLNGGLLEYAQMMVAHESSRTTKLYDRQRLGHRFNDPAGDLQSYSPMPPEEPIVDHAPMEFARPSIFLFAPSRLPFKNAQGKPHDHKAAEHWQSLIRSCCYCNYAFRSYCTFSKIF